MKISFKLYVRHVYYECKCLYYIITLRKWFDGIDPRLFSFMSKFLNEELYDRTPRMR